VGLRDRSYHPRQGWFARALPNDGQSVPGDLVVDALLELEQQIGAVSA
jgi:hypothetical protein